MTPEPPTEREHREALEALERAKAVIAHLRWKFALPETERLMAEVEELHQEVKA